MINNLLKIKSDDDKYFGRFAFDQDCETICQAYSTCWNLLKKFDYTDKQGTYSKIDTIFEG